MTWTRGDMAARAAKKICDGFYVNLGIGIPPLVANYVVAVMKHTDKTYNPKLLHACDLPLTGAGVLDLVISDLAVFEVDKHKGGVTLIELALRAITDEVRAKTQADYSAAASLSWPTYCRLVPKHASFYSK